MTCVALEEGCTLVQVPRALFLRFVLECPKALQIYLQKVTVYFCVRVWGISGCCGSPQVRLDLEVPKVSEVGPP